MTTDYIYLPCARSETSSYPLRTYTYVYIYILKKAAAKEKEVPSDTQMVIKTFISSSDLLAFSHNFTCLNTAWLRRRHLLFFSLVHVWDALLPPSHFHARPDTRRKPTEVRQSLGSRQTTPDGVNVKKKQKPS